MCQVDPDGPTEEEHRKKSVTKTRYLSYRDERSTTKALCKFDKLLYQISLLTTPIFHPIRPWLSVFSPIARREMTNCHCNH